MRRRALNGAAIAALVALVAAALWRASNGSGDSSWPGVDEAVVRRVAEEAGRRPGAVFEWVQGDLLLFAFLWAGLLCGFALGYTARALFVERIDAVAPEER